VEGMMNEALIDGVEYRVLKCNFDQSMNGGLYMQILVEGNDKVEPDRYPFESGFLFQIALPSACFTKSESLIRIEFDEPHQDSSVTVYTGEHDLLKNIRATLKKGENDAWTMQMTGIIDLYKEKKNFSILCEAQCFQGKSFEYL
jgi:hypothetical protein